MTDPDPFSTDAPWEERLAFVVDTMRELSRYTDPHEMVAAYSERMRSLRMDRFLSLSRRGVEPPHFVLARDSDWTTQANPWRERDQLPVLSGGLLGEIVFGNEVRVIQDLQLPDDDPNADLLRGYRSLVAYPVFDGGEGLNVVVFLRKEPNAVDVNMIPQQVWTSNLFGRLTHNLVLARQLAEANDALANEARLIADIQRSLLPAELPEIPTLDLAAYYKPAAQAGGDYYDFFPLADGQWGLLIADVSGHGSPAAVEMAITRTLAHVAAREDATPASVLSYVNRNLVTRIGRAGGAFVTAFFGVYDPARRRLRFASAGHHPPRLKRCSDGSLFTLSCDPAPPLGVVPDQEYREAEQALIEGDQMILYTDGLVEAFDPDGMLFGLERLDGVLEHCGVDAHALIESVVAALQEFARGLELKDDVTLVVARVTGSS